MPRTGAEKILPFPGREAESESKKPERLLPIHPGGEIEREKELTPQERYQERQKALRDAPDLEFLLKREMRAKVVETPPTMNLALAAVNDFERTVREAQDLRKVVRYSRDAKEKAAALALYNEKKKDVDAYLAYGLSFEKAYREYLGAKNEYGDFLAALGEMRQLEDMLLEPAFKELAPEANLDSKSQARLEMIMRAVKLGEVKAKKEELLESLKTIYPEGSPEYEQAVKELLGKEAPGLPKSKKETREMLTRLRDRAGELWENPMVRYFSQRVELEKLLKDFSEGKDVLETPRTIERLNELYDWEREHARTTIGGVLVGPPGVGKTTLLRHYLDERGRKYVYIDLSEDVTRYMLYGSKALEFKSPSEYYQHLITQISTLEPETFRKFVTENAKKFQEVFELKKDEAVAAFLGQLEQELARGTGVSPELAAELDRLKTKVTSFAQQAYRKELAGEFAHLVKKNGWRDGVITAALRRGDSVIFDEFNKNKNWSLLYGLMTAKPGEEWYFADNDEYIKIPESWRMYFTANIGRKHGGFQVAEAMASRAGGKVMEVDYPAPREEMRVALAAFSNPEGDLLRGKDDLAKLFVLVHELFPKIRHFTEDKPQSIPISYRTLRDLGEKLVLYRDPKTKKSIFKPQDRAFDQALYLALVESYSLYEDKAIPREIVNLATTVGLLLDDSVREKVIKWIGKETYDERRKKFEEHKEDFAEIVKKIKGISRETMEAEMPPVRKF